MKRFLFLSALLSLFLVRVAAQGTLTDSVKAKIRDIKLSEKYLYAETASMTSLEEARSEALEGLHIRVVEILAGQGKEKAEMEAVWEKVGQQYAGLDYRNGSLVKVFLYLPKHMLTGEPAEAAVSTGQPAIAEQPVIAEHSAVVEQPVTETGQPAGTEQQPEGAETQPVSTQPATATVIDPNLPDENSFAMNEEEKQEEEKAEEQPAEPEEQQAAEVVAETPVPQATPETEMPEEAPQSESEPAAASEATPLVNPLDTVSDTHRRVLTDLLKLDTYEGVMLYLSSMKEDGRLMYGRIGTLVAPEQAYFIIIKEGQLLTILNRGKGERINLRSLQPEMLKQYKGHAIIWLKIFN